jgi:hypothetical protein
MKSIKIYPLSLALVVIYFLILMNFRVGTYIGITGILLYIFGIFFFKNEKEKWFPLIALLVIILVQFYAYYARLNLLPHEINANGIEGAIGGAFLLMSLIVIAPFLSIFPTLKLATINKKFLLLILPSSALAAYWYFYLYSVVGYY